jgi:hypothetical protein
MEPGVFLVGLFVDYRSNQLTNKHTVAGRERLSGHYPPFTPAP